MAPDVGSKNRVSSPISVLLPAPVGPVIPTRIPGRIENDTPSMTGCASSYAKVTFRNSMEPVAGELYVTLFFPFLMAKRLDDRNRSELFLNHLERAALERLHIAMSGTQLALVSPSQKSRNRRNTKGDPGDGSLDRHHHGDH